ncbi:MAG: hypothetical protein P4L28_00315 [Paludibacteraceae bacterium]|nr:hypothetical protein [Paludibacteraceae bacterium]
MTNEQAEYLLKLPKKIVGKNGLLDKITIDQKFPFSERFELVSPNDDEFTFLMVINQSTKNSIRISFHHQENESKIGLLRVDYNSGHKNPENITDSLPEKFHPFVGKDFAKDEHHIHYHVEKYKSLAWAIPISQDSFGLKKFNDDNEFNNTFASVIQLFAKVVNIETEIAINKLLL